MASNNIDRRVNRIFSKLNIDAKFYDYLFGEKLFEKIRNSRAVVLPSEWYENAPLSIMEAYILGIPVIGAAIGGIPELIKDDETGFTFKSGSSKSLADKMLKMSQLSEFKVRNMGLNGRNWMLAEYTPDIYRERLLSLYSKYNIL